jgi:hypothetical protein
MSSAELSASTTATTVPATSPSVWPSVTCWRTSSFSDRGNCVAVAELGDGRVAVRNSNRPDAGTIDFPPAALRAWIDGAKAGELDDLT